jgi:hypothetical protein
MKKITCSLFLLGAMFANAQTITQSESQDILTGNTVACQASGLATADNFYYRFFKLADDHDITADYNITQVQFGVDVVDHAVDPSHAITVKLYAATATFPTGFSTLTGYTLVATQTFDVANQAEPSIVNGDITGTIPAGSNLVVEVSYLGDPEGNAVVSVGTNDAGETGTTYLAAPGCDVTAPTDASSLVANSEVDLVLNVVGTQGTAGLNENVISGLSVFPNPTSGLINIELAGSTINGATITDITGKVMKLKLAGNSVDISNFASGVYFLNLDTDKGMATRKIVKE